MMPNQWTAGTAVPIPKKNKTITDTIKWKFPDAELCGPAEGAWLVVTECWPSGAIRQFLSREMAWRCRPTDCGGPCRGGENHYVMAARKGKGEDRFYYCIVMDMQPKEKKVYRCQACGEEMRKPRHSKFCFECSRSAKEKSCAKCGKEIEAGRKWCEKCGVRKASMEYMARQELGLCGMCGGIPAPGRKMCSRCLEHDRKRNRPRRTKAVA